VDLKTLAAANDGEIGVSSGDGIPARPLDRITANERATVLFEFAQKAAEGDVGITCRIPGPKYLPGFLEPTEHAARHAGCNLSRSAWPKLSVDVAR